MYHSSITSALSAPPHFDLQERQVIQLAMLDPVISLRDMQGRLNKVLGWVWGVNRTYTFANPRLEALRRTVVLIRSGRKFGSQDIEALVEHGYAGSKFEALRDEIGRTTLGEVGHVPVAA